MKRALGVFFLGWSYLILLGGVLPFLPHDWPYPDLVLLMTVYASLRLSKYGWLPILLLGILQDLYAGTPLGANAFSKLLIYLLIRWGAEKFFLTSTAASMITTLLAASLDFLLFSGILLLLGLSPPLMEVRALYSWGITALFAPFLFHLNDRLLGSWQRSGQPSSHEVGQVQR